MATTSELLAVPAFAGLPEDQLEWFLGQVQEVNVKAGETYARAGDPADTMFVILDGQVQWRGEFGGQAITINSNPRDVTGALPFSRMTQFTVSARAMTDLRLLKFPIKIPGTSPENAGANQAASGADVRPHP